MGVQFFGGKFYKCLDEEGERLEIDVVDNKWECFEKNYTWVNSKIHFDHVGHAYLALFQGTYICISCGRVVRDFESKAKTRCNFQFRFQEVIDLTKFSKITLCRASEANSEKWS